MTPDEELWAEALAIERIHGEAASSWVEERIGVLTRAGDMAGVARFRAIATRLEILRRNLDQV